MLNYEQMKQVASRNGVIRWLHSRKVEFLSLEGENVVALRLYPRGKHIIKRNPQYLCVELAPSARVMVCDLDWRDGYAQTVENQRDTSRGRNGV